MNDRTPAERKIRLRLGGPEFRTLFAAARRRIEEHGRGSARSVTLPTLSEDERRALADLHGWRTLPEGRVRVSLARLDAVLRASSLRADLVDVLEALGGPLLDRRADREAERAARDDRWDQARQRLRGDRPELLPWLDDIRSLGLLARGARATGLGETALLDLALNATQRLPAPGTVLSVLAAEVAGDAHALDAGRPLAALVLRAAAHLAGWPEVPASAAARRRLWGEVGVLCDPLSAQVLVFGLRPSGDDLLARHLREAAEAGEPRRLTLRELAGKTLAVEGGIDVFVCENPGVVNAAADQLGARSAPLVCVEGVPSTAALELLDRLGRGGARLHFHADFDWAGLRIGNRLAGLTGTQPWRFTNADYRAALATASDAIPIKGRAVPAAWDPALEPALRAAGRAIFEEQLLASLLEDLDRAAGAFAMSKKAAGIREL